MVNEAHAEGSSSPNGSRTIYGVRSSDSRSRKDGVSARTRGTRRSDVEVILSDGSSFFVPTSLWVRIGRAEGEAADDEWLTQLHHQVDVSAARNRALSLQARREHSRCQLRRKLIERDIDPVVADIAIDSLLRDRLVDDARFARMWVESRLRRHPEGRAALFAGLLRSGVSRELAEQSLDELNSADGDVLDRALEAAAARLERSGALEPQVLTRKLAARGFSYQRIRNYLSRRENSSG